MATTIRRVALTGGIASGKSLVGDYLRRRNVPVIDADDVVHGLLQSDQAIRANIRQNFGDDVFVPGSGAVDRKKLGAKVFRNPGRRKLLESWIHPKVREVIENFFLQHKDKPLGVALIPLLFESKLESRYDEVWLIDTDRDTQIQRLMATRNLTREEALARIDSQMSAEEKRRRTRALPSYEIIDNRGPIQAVYDQLRKLLAKHGI